MSDPFDPNLMQEYQGIFVGGPIEGQMRTVMSRRDDLIPVVGGHRAPTLREEAAGIEIQPEMAYYKIEPSQDDDGPLWIFVYQPDAS